MSENDIKYVKITYQRAKFYSDQIEEKQYIAGSDGAANKDMELLVREMLSRGYFVIGFISVEHSNDIEVLRGNA